jgi:hypothetical protein
LTISDNQAVSAASVSSLSTSFWGYVRERPSAAPRAVEGGAAAVALNVHLQGRGMVHEPIYCRERHRLIREDPAPISKRLICRDQHRSALVTGGEELGEHAGLGLVLGDVVRSADGSNLAWQ